MRRQPVWRRASAVPTVQWIKARLWPTPLLLPEHLYRRLTKRSRTFHFRGKVYKYLFHRYQVAGLTERTVEVPIAAEIMRAFQSNSVLEVGNVLSHYRMVKHDVVDKYEIARGVENVDVLEYRPNKTYELILSISTLEHVGWDEFPREKTKWLQAIRHLRTLLTPGGLLFITIPVGLNADLDAALRNGVAELDEIYGMRRLSKENEWTEAPVEEALNAEYNHPFPFANALIVAIAYATGERQGRPSPLYGT